MESLFVLIIAFLMAFFLKKIIVDPLLEKSRQDRALRERVTYGLGTEQNPVRCEQLHGEIEYLKRLRTLDGRKVQYERRGSYGNGGPWNNHLDGYAIYPEDEEDDGETYYFDMYHFGFVEEHAIDGFSIESSEWTTRDDYKPLTDQPSVG